MAIGGIALKSASDSENALAQLDARLKSTGGVAGVTRQAAIDLASGLQQVTTYSDETILSGENLMLTFTNIGQGVFADATTAAVDMSAALEQDLQSSVMQLGKSLNDPIAGISALGRVGVKFTQSTKDQIKALVESGNVMGAQKIILQELQTEFGGAAKAAGQTFSGRLSILKNKFDDIFESIGNKLLPVAGKFLTLLSNLSDRVLPIIMPLVDSLANGLTTFFTALDDGVDPLEAVGMAIFRVFGEQSRGIVSFLKEAGDLLTTFFAQLGAGRDPLEALGSAFLTVFGNAGMPVFDFLMRARDTIINVVIPAIQTFVGILGNIWAQIQPGLNSLYLWFTQDALPKVRDFVVNEVIPKLQTFWDFLSGAWAKISPELNKLKDWFLTDGLPKVKNFVENEVRPALDKVFGWLGRVWDETIHPGLENLRKWFLEEALPKVRDFVENTFKPALDRVFGWLGHVWDETVKPGLENLKKWFLETALPSVQNFVENTFKPALDRVFGWLGRVWDETISPGLNKLHDWFVTGGLQRVITSVQEFFNHIGELPGKIQEWIDKQGVLAQRVEDFILALTVLSGVYIVYNVLAAVAAGISAAVALGVGAITTAINVLLGPIGLAVIGLTALIALYHEVAKLQASYNATQDQGLTSVNASGLTRQQYLDKAFKASADQQGDFGARLTWGGTNPGVYQGVGGTAAKWYDENVKNGNIKVPQTRDSGGSGRAGGAYLIGKGAQPEMFMPSTNGTFVPNADKMTGGGGITVQSLVINASGAAEGEAAGNAFVGVLDEYQSRGNR